MLNFTMKLFFLFVILGEDAFLAAAITSLDPSQVQFNLSPTYALYMAARYRASTHFRPDTTPNDRAHRLTALMNKVATVMHQVIQVSLIILV